MKTKYIPLLYCLLMALVGLFLMIFGLIKGQAKGVEIGNESFYLIGGGDCSADRATGDLYVNPDSYCLTESGQYPAKTIFSNEPGNTPAKVSTPIPNNPVLPVVTPSPTDSPEEPPVITSTPDPTDEPTEEPTGEPEPTEEPGKVCKNKNDDRKPGENPTDCNAGGGNG